MMNVSSQLMMTLVKYLLFLGMCFVLVLPTEAQIGRIIRKVERKVTDKVEDKAAEKAGEAVDKTIDKAFEPVDGEQPPSGDNSEVSTNENGDLVITTTEENGETTTVTLSASDEPYNPKASEFVGKFTFIAEEYKNGRLQKDYPQKTLYYLKPLAIGMVPLNQSDEISVVLIDREKRTITSKGSENGQKVAYVMPIAPVSVAVDNQTMANGDYQVSATGRSKQIEGYTAQEYKVTSEEGEGTIWVSETLDFNFMEMFDFIKVKDQETGTLKDFSDILPVDGSIMEYDFTNTKGERSTWRMTDITPNVTNEAIFSLQGYKIRDLSRFMDSDE